MSEDYKWNAQLHAEEAAELEYGKEYFDLPEETRTRLYNEALQLCAEKRVAEAEWRRKQVRERECSNYQ